MSRNNLPGAIRKYGRVRPGPVRGDAAKILKFNRGQLAIVRRQMSELVAVIEKEMTPEAIEYVLNLISNLAKNPSRPFAWVDRTGNLRRSIMVEILAPGESKIVNYDVGSAPARNETKDTVGFVFAGMEYAAPLESLPKYSVLGYAVEAMRNRLTPELIKMLKFKRRPI